MEPATADPSLLTDTATSDTSGSVVTVAGVELISVGTLVAVGTIVVVGAVVVGKVRYGHNITSNIG